MSARRALALAAVMAAPLAAGALHARLVPGQGGPEWVLPQRYRLLLQVDARRGSRSRTAASVDVDLASALAEQGGGALDPASVELVAYDAQDRPYVFDRAASGADRYPLPWRAEPLYPLSRQTLSFAVPDRGLTRYAVYFDTAGSPRADARRYAGLVGDGDFFSERYGRREVAPSAFDDMADLDGDGGLDLVRGGTEPVLRVFECLGGPRYVDRGWLTSGGRSWCCRTTTATAPGSRWRCSTGTAMATPTSSRSSWPVLS